MLWSASGIHMEFNSLEPCCCHSVQKLLTIQLNQQKTNELHYQAISLMTQALISTPTRKSWLKSHSSPQQDDLINNVVSNKHHTWIMVIHHFQYNTIFCQNFTTFCLPWFCSFLTGQLPTAGPYYNQLAELGILYDLCGQLTKQLKSIFWSATDSKKSVTYSGQCMHTNKVSLVIIKASSKALKTTGTS